MTSGVEEGNIGPGRTQDPFRAYSFEVEVMGHKGHFTQCTGLGMKIEAIEYREAGGDPLQVHRIPGRVSYGDITLKYGVTASKVLWDWFMQGASGNVARQSVTVRMLSPDGSRDVAGWNLINAWISEWQGTPLDVSTSKLAIETVTLVYDRLEPLEGSQGG